MPAVTQILVVGLSNIGDAILMSPVIEHLHDAFPQARLTLLAGERAHSLFVNDPRVQRLVCFDEFEGIVGRLRLVRFLWALHPDLLVDLRHTVLPLLWKPWRVARYFWPLPNQIAHMQQRHLARLFQQAGSLTSAGTPTLDGRVTIWIDQADRVAIDKLLTRWHSDPTRSLVVICPGARSHIKCWDPDRFAYLAERLIDDARAEVIVTGEPDERPIVDDMLGAMRHREHVHSAVGLTMIRQLGALLQRASLVITNDSASLHLACAVGVPVLALFGPTDPRKYGPTGTQDRVIQRRLFCVPCEQALCRFHHECMRFISVDEVYDAARQILGSGKWKVESGKDSGR